VRLPLLTQYSWQGSLISLVSDTRTQKARLSAGLLVTDAYSCVGPQGIPSWRTTPTPLRTVVSCIPMRAGSTSRWTSSGAGTRRSGLGAEYEFDRWGGPWAILPVADHRGTFLTGTVANGRRLPCEVDSTTCTLVEWPSGYRAYYTAGVAAGLVRRPGAGRHGRERLHVPPQPVLQSGDGKLHAVGSDRDRWRAEHVRVCEW
jgi:hypothetical protein